MDYKSFLEKIRMIESSGGTDLDHEPMKEGIHKGSSAYGQYGLMPNTIREMSRRQRIAKNIDPEITAFENSEDEEIVEQLKNKPELEQQFAEKLAEHIFNRQKGDEEKAAYAWNQGHNLYPENIDADKLEKTDYIKKFRNINNILKNKRLAGEPNE